MKRQPKMIAICGGNGTGKTWLTKNKLIPSLNRRALVIDSDNLEPEWYGYDAIDLRKKDQCDNFERGYSAFKWYESKGLDFFWKCIYHNVNDCTLVLDDCRDFIPPTITTVKNLRNVFSRRRQKMLDIIIIQHSVDDIPKGLTRYLNALVLFNTQDTPQGIATRFNNKGLISEVEKVKQGVKNNKHFYRTIELNNFNAE